MYGMKDKIKKKVLLRKKKTRNEGKRGKKENQSKKENLKVMGKENMKTSQ